MVRLPASGDCFEVKVMSGQEKRYPKDQCDKMAERAVLLTSEAWRMLRQDVQVNCQLQECTQIRGAADGLFLTIDQVLQKIPMGN